MTPWKRCLWRYILIKYSKRGIAVNGKIPPLFNHLYTLICLTFYMLFFSIFLFDYRMPSYKIFSKTLLNQFRMEEDRNSIFWRQAFKQNFFSNKTCQKQSHLDLEVASWILSHEMYFFFEGSLWDIKRPILHSLLGKPSKKKRKKLDWESIRSSPSTYNWLT